MEERIKEELLLQILDCGWKDIDKLTEYIKLYCIVTNSSVSEAIEDIIEDVNSYQNTVDINSLLYSAISLTFYAICDLLKDKCPQLEGKISELEENFNPFVNYFDSHFNNIFDEIDILNCNDRNEIIEKVKNTLTKD